jgi:V-type H+-transporting ATPase subunit E
MITKNNLVEKVISDSLDKLTDFAKPNNQRYRQLVKELILQGMVKLLEPVCIIRVRKEDVEFVSGVIKECEKEFAQIMKKETGADYSCKLQIDGENHIENKR